jgi:hypothetical protein
VFRPGEAHVSTHTAQLWREALVEAAGKAPAYAQSEFEDLFALLDDALDDRHQRAIELRVAGASR